MKHYVQEVGFSSLVASCFFAGYAAAWLAEEHWWAILGGPCYVLLVLPIIVRWSETL